MSDHIEEGIDLLRQICLNLEADGIPLPPEILNWWLNDQKEQNPVIVTP